MKRALLLCFVVFAAGCARMTPIEPCVARSPAEAGTGLALVCGVQNAEDIAAVPGTPWLVVSSMAGAADGGLLLLDTRSHEIQGAYPNSRRTAAPGAPVWGEPGCQAPAALAPHGIDLAKLADGALRLLVVNHGTREAVEMFEVDADASPPTLTWRGCVEGLAGNNYNDVVGLAEGGFLVTHMMAKTAGLFSWLGAMLGRDTGEVYEWSPGGTLEPLAGTAGPGPNGIALAADERHVFVNFYFEGRVAKIDRASGATVASAAVTRPDNSTWHDGRLLVASHTDSIFELLACVDENAGACGFGFEIVALDPDVMEPSTVLTWRGEPMGAATVAVPFGGRLYLGSFASDRIAHAPYP